MENLKNNKKSLNTIINSINYKLFLISCLSFILFYMYLVIILFLSDNRCLYLWENMWGLVSCCGIFVNTIVYVINNFKKIYKFLIN